jgi:hypothetical protein
MATLCSHVHFARLGTTKDVPHLCADFRKGWPFSHIWVLDVAYQYAVYMSHHHDTKALDLKRDMDKPWLRNCLSLILLMKWHWLRPDKH